MQEPALDDLTVLIIDDDVDVAEMYRLRLIADGYNVVVAYGGEEGVGLARGWLPDFIYLDVRLPGMDGFEVLELIRQVPATRNIPVIILTNDGDPALRERGQELGALGVLVKSETTPSQLSEAVRRTTSDGIGARS